MSYFFIMNTLFKLNLSIISIISAIKTNTFKYYLKFSKFANF